MTTPPPPPPPQLYTVAQTRAILCCSRRTVDRLAAKGLLKVVRLGRAVRISRESVESLIEKGGRP